MSDTDAIKVGDYVKNAAGTEGRVFRVQGSQIRVATGYNTTVVGNVSDWTKTDSMFASAIGNAGIAVGEIAQNAVAFAAINKVVSGSVYDAETKNFIICDVLTEGFLGALFQNYGLVAFKDDDLVPLVGKDAQSVMPSELSLKQALNKLIPLTVVDTALRYFMKQSQTKGRITNVLKVYAALVAGNAIEKSMRKPNTPPSFLPR